MYDHTIERCSANTSGALDGITRIVAADALRNEYTMKRHINGWQHDEKAELALSTIQLTLNTDRLEGDPVLYVRGAQHGGQISYGVTHDLWQLALDVVRRQFGRKDRRMKVDELSASEDNDSDAITSIANAQSRRTFPHSLPALSACRIRIRHDCPPPTSVIRCSVQI